jgi:mono/diheme cytochrome c family protein
MSRALLLIVALMKIHAADVWAGRVPTRSAALQNPYSGEENAALAGAKLYSQRCAACHGPERGGSSHVPEITSPQIKEFTDGQLFWLLTNGRLKAGMPSWSSLPPQQRWQIVTFLRR